MFPGQQRITAAFGYDAPHPSVRGTSTLLIHALPSAHYAAIRLPESRLPPLLTPLVGHTRTIMIGCHGSPRNFRASLVALMTRCVARAGERLRGSSRSLPIPRREVLPSGVHRPWAESNRYKISELMPFTAEWLHPVGSPSLPFCVRFKIRLQAKPLYASCNTRYGACG